MPGDENVVEGVLPERVEAEVRQFTWRELSKLNQPHNAHVAYRGKVYDVSAFVQRHPGGADQIMMGAGRDMTQLFESYHKLEVVKVLEKFYVGELIDNELPVFPPMSQFYITLRRRVDEFFKSNNIDPKIDYWMFLRYFNFTIISLIFWCLMLYFHTSWLLGLTFTLCWGFSAALVTMALGHDSSHFCITHKPWVWVFVAFIAECTTFSSFVWSYQHVFGHHTYTNIDDADPDIGTAEVDLRRVKWSQKWLPHYLYQHIYVPMVYGFLGIRTWIVDFPVMLSRRVFRIRINDPNSSQMMMFVSCKVVYVVMRIVIPALIMPFTKMVVFIVLAEMIYSYWIAMNSQSSHVTGSVSWPKADKNGFMNVDWAEMQISTTQDFATNSWFWTVFTGGLNHQTIHHLFPGVIPSHLPKIAPIVRQTCAEFGVKYNHVESAMTAMGNHVHHLKVLGQNANPKKD